MAAFGIVTSGKGQSVKDSQVTGGKLEDTWKDQRPRRTAIYIMAGAPGRVFVLYSEIRERRCSNSCNSTKQLSREEVEPSFAEDFRQGRGTARSC